jgi:prepilin-type N-terminal cleavage/methylation domain-containing protein
VTDSLNTRCDDAGFTLIELSIVLVIIGLIVGGVLVGQDLIKAAEVRATISQVEKFNTAVNTFYGKFGYLPGDVPQTVATQFGLPARGSYCCSGISGNGNGYIDGMGAYYGSSGSSECGEPLMAWVDLTIGGNLIEGAFNTTALQPLLRRVHSRFP